MHLQLYRVILFFSANSFYTSKFEKVNKCRKIMQYSPRSSLFALLLVTDYPLGVVANTRFNSLYSLKFLCCPIGIVAFNNSLSLYLIIILKLMVYFWMIRCFLIFNLMFTLYTNWLS